MKSPDSSNSARSSKQSTMFAILWENRQNPRIWPKSSHLGPPERYSQECYEWIFPDFSPGASPVVDLAAFDQGAFEPPMLSLGLRRFQPRWVPKPRRAIEPRAETLNSVGGCRLQARGAKPS